MGLNLALIMTIFLTRERWAAWVVETDDAGGGFPIDVPADSVKTKRAVILWNDRFVLWDVETSKRIASFEPEILAYFATFSPDGTKLLMSVEAEEDRGMTIVVNAEDGEQLATLEGSEGEDEASFSPDGRLILAQTDLAHLCVWRAADGSRALKLKPNGDECCDAGFSPDGGAILTYTAGEVSLWDVRTGERRKSLLKINSQFTSAAFCAGGRNVIVWLGKEAVLLDTKSGTCVARTKAFGLGAISRDGRTFAVERTEAGPVAIHDAATGEMLVETQLSGVARFSYADDGKRLLVERREDRNDLLAILDTRTGGIVGEIPYDHMDPFALSPDGARILVKKRWAPARLHSARTGQLLAEWPEGWPVGFLGNDRVMQYVSDNESEGIRVLRRIRPEEWWGVLCLWHFWLIVALGAALAWSGWRDIRRMERRASRARGEVGEVG